MIKRIAPRYQVLLVSALQLILTTQVAYTAEIKTSKTKIKNYLKQIADTDKKISLTEDKLTVLRSDVENANQDSITRENTFKIKVKPIKKELADLDTLIKKNKAEQKKIGEQRAEVVQDSVSVEKKRAEALLKLAKERVYLDSLMDAINKEKEQIQKEKEKARKDSSDIKKAFEAFLKPYKIQVLLGEI